MSTSSPYLLQELAFASLMLPFLQFRSTLATPHLISQIASHLPPLVDALTIVGSYFSRPSWTIDPVNRTEVAEELLPAFYRNRQPINPQFVKGGHLHRLGLLFSILAYGRLLKPEGSGSEWQSNQYYHLARAALCLGRALERGSAEACQALIIISIYAKHNQKKQFQEMEWRITNMALRLAVTVSFLSLIIMTTQYVLINARRLNCVSGPFFE